jgi:hypothetical protein
MRKTQLGWMAWMGVTVLTSALGAGCSRGTQGGPGANGKQATFGQAADTFTLSVPMMSSSVQQGATTSAVVGIVRGENFDEDVALLFPDLPQGVTVEPASPQIKRGDKDAKIEFRAQDETATGDFKINVTGHPTKGTDAQIGFQLAVTPRDSFTISVPGAATSLVQGNSKSVEISIDRQKSFDEDVTLKLDELPTGVTAEPSEPVIKRGESMARMVLTATEEASLGNFTVKVTGVPTQGNEATSLLRLDVAQK